MEEIIFDKKKDRKDIPKDRIICPLCWENNQTSTIRLAGGRITQRGINSYYDEEGLHHIHDGNVGRGKWNCSNKHQGEYFKYTKCPTCNYGDGNIKLVADETGVISEKRSCEITKKDIPSSSRPVQDSHMIFPPTMNNTSKPWNIF
jgi:hypothetical protein